MPDGATQVQQNSSGPVLTEAMHDWVHAFTGVDSRGGSAVGAAPGGSAPRAAAPGAGSAGGAAPGGAPAGDTKPKDPNATEWKHGKVSDPKEGSGYNATGSRGDKVNLGHGFEPLERKFSGGAKIIVNVKQVGKGDTPKFQFSTTITFDASVSGSTSRKSADPKPMPEDAGPDTKIGSGSDTKHSMSMGANASAAVTASYRRVLSGDEAKLYMDSMKNGGDAGAKFPEQKIMFTGAMHGAAAARGMYANLTGSPSVVSALKPGEEIETSLEAKGGGKVGGTLNTGNHEIGAQAAGSVSHKITITKAGMDDPNLVKVTARVDDAHEASASVSVKEQVGGKGEWSGGTGKGRTIVFTLNKTDMDYAKHLHDIDKADSAEDLDALANGPMHNLVGSTTERHSRKEGDAATVMARDASGKVMGDADLNAEKTVDKDGKLINSKVVGHNATGAELGYKDTKIGIRVDEKYAGSADGSGNAQANASEKTTQLDKAATIAQFVAHPINSFKDPKKAVKEKSDMRDLALSRSDLEAVCQAAANPGKWKGLGPSGNSQKEWDQTGAAIRSALTMKDDRVVDADWTTVNEALAQFVASKDGERLASIKKVLRPLDGKHGAIRGKASEFPQGTEKYQDEWEELVHADPISAAREKAVKDPKGALEDLHKVLTRLNALTTGIKTDIKKWDDFKVEFGEMQLHIGRRLGETNLAIREVEKALVGGHDPNAAAKDLQVELKNYNAALAGLKEMKTAVFGQLSRIRQMVGANDKSFSQLKAESNLMMLVKDNIRIWDPRYNETFAMWRKLSQQTHLEESEVTQYHTKGAWDEVEAVTKLVKAQTSG